MKNLFNSKIALFALSLGTVVSVSFSTAEAVRAESESGGFICVGAGDGSESGGLMSVGANSESGGVMGSGAETNSGGPRNSGAESESGGVFSNGSESETGGARTAGSSESGGQPVQGMDRLQFGVHYYKW